MSDIDAKRTSGPDYFSLALVGKMIGFWQMRAVLPEGTCNGAISSKFIASSAAAWPLAAHAQRPTKWLIGFLGMASPTTFAARLEGLRLGLRDFGYVEGTNITMEYRFAEGHYERLPELAADLVRSKVDLIVTHGTPGSLAAKRATTTIPIVLTSVGDPVASGIVASIARPGGNITGQSLQSGAQGKENRVAQGGDAASHSCGRHSKRGQSCFSRARISGNGDGRAGAQYQTATIPTAEVERVGECL